MKIHAPFPELTALCGIVALCLVREVAGFWLPLICVFWIGAKLRPPKISDRVILGAIVAVLVGTCGSYFGAYASLSHSLVIALLLVHSFLLVSVRGDRFQSAILAIAFVDLVIAMVLNPDYTMIPLVVIFTFAAIGTLIQMDSDTFTKPLTGVLFRQVVFVTLGVFLVAVLLFPILPRKNQDKSFGGGGRGEIGYAEIIDLKDPILSLADDGDHVVMRVIAKNPEQLRKSIPRGLLRGKVLGSFDGQQWRPGLKQLSVFSDDQPGLEGDLVLIRDPMNTELLPAPYGTTRLGFDSGNPSRRFVTGEWIAPTLKKSKVIYHINANGFQPARDMPLESQLRVPADLDTSELQNLARELSKGNQSSVEKIRSVNAYFSSKKFQAILPGGSENLRTSALDNFLFGEHKGHCELYASAAAMVLRKMGIPARVVAGFRVVWMGEESVLAVNSNNAHAWVEAWQGGEWAVLDPTPILLAPVSEWKMLTRFKNSVGLFWYRKVLSYDDTVSWFSSPEFWFVLVALGAIMVIMLLSTRVKPGWQRLRSVFRKKSNREKLQKIYLRNERLLQARCSRDTLNLREYYEHWRFGRDLPSGKEVAEFSRRVEGIKKTPDQASSG